MDEKHCFGPRLAQPPGAIMAALETILAFCPFLVDRPICQAAFVNLPAKMADP